MKAGSFGLDKQFGHSRPRIHLSGLRPVPSSARPYCRSEGGWAAASRKVSGFPFKGALGVSRSLLEKPHRGMANDGSVAFIHGLLVME
jgi:hypothetical protein